MPPSAPGPGCGVCCEVEEEEEEEEEEGEWKISTVKVPPVDGWRATSPSEVENVERSSWAYCLCGRLV